MSSVNFKTEKNYTNQLVDQLAKNFLRGFLFSFFFFVQVTVHALDIDFSRRAPGSSSAPQVVNPSVVATAPVTESKVINPTKNIIMQPQSSQTTEVSGRSTDAEILKALKKAVQPIEPSKEIVILNTENGFIPDKVRVRKGEAYKVHIVNLNMKEKNVSFLMDSFTQSHNTVYGLMKSFNIEPQVEGIYSYQCPETGIQGQLIVVQDIEKRKPASATEEGN